MLSEEEEPAQVQAINEEDHEEYHEEYHEEDHEEDDGNGDENILDSLMCKEELSFSLSPKLTTKKKTMTSTDTCAAQRPLFVTSNSDSSGNDKEESETVDTVGADGNKDRDISGVTAAEEDIDGKNKSHKDLDDNDMKHKKVKDTNIKLPKSESNGTGGDGRDDCDNRNTITTKKKRKTLTKRLPLSKNGDLSKEDEAKQSIESLINHKNCNHRHLVHNLALLPSWTAKALENIPIVSVVFCSYRANGIDKFSSYFCLVSI